MNSSDCLVGKRHSSFTRWLHVNPRLVCMRRSSTIGRARVRGPCSSRAPGGPSRRGSRARGHAGAERSPRSPTAQVAGSRRRSSWCSVFAHIPGCGRAQLWCKRTGEHSSGQGALERWIGPLVGRVVGLVAARSVAPSAGLSACRAMGARVVELIGRAHGRLVVGRSIGRSVRRSVDRWCASSLRRSFGLHRSVARCVVRADGLHSL